MDKKTYIRPTIEVVETETVEMIAASIGIDKDGQGGGEMLSTGRRGSWGNLWASEE